MVILGHILGFIGGGGLVYSTTMYAFSTSTYARRDPKLLGQYYQAFVTGAAATIALISTAALLVG